MRSKASGSVVFSIPTHAHLFLFFVFLIISLTTERNAKRCSSIFSPIYYNKFRGFRFLCIVQENMVLTPSFMLSDLRFIVSSKRNAKERTSLERKTLQDMGFGLSTKEKMFSEVCNFWTNMCVSLFEML